MNFAKTSMGIVCAAFLLAACAGKDTEPRLPGGTGGSGGSDGHTPADEPSWEGWEIEHATHHSTLAATTGWWTGRVGAEGKPGILVAGYGLAAVPWGEAPAWTHRNLKGFSPGDRLVDVATFPSSSEGERFLIVTQSGAGHGRALLVDGGDGSTRWSTELELDPPGPEELAIFGSDADPLFLPVYGRAVRSVNDGKVRWQHRLSKSPIFAQPIRTGDGVPSGIALAVDRGQGTPEQAPDLFLFSAEGERIAEMTSERFLTAMGTARRPGMEEDMLLVGTNDGRLTAFAADGSLLWRKTFDLHEEANVWMTFVDEIRVVDGPDGEPTILVVLEEAFQIYSILVALDAEGNESWREPIQWRTHTLKVVDTSTGPLAAVALEQFGGLHGGLAAYDVSTGALAWNHADLASIAGLHVVDGDLFLGTVDGHGRLFEAANGRLKQAIYLGGSFRHVFPTDEGAVAIDEFGTLSEFRRDGTVAWNHSLLNAPLQALGEVVLVQGGAEQRIAAGVYPFIDPAGGGLLEIRSLAGKRTSSLRLDNYPTALAAADLDGDGQEELVTIHIPNRPQEPCTVAAYPQNSTQPVWRANLGPCAWVWIDVDRRPSDEGPTVAVTGYTHQSLPFVASIDREGTVRWMNELDHQSQWVLSVSGGAAVGGVGEDGHGFVSRFDDEGTLLWTTRIPLRRDPEDPTKNKRGFTYYGTRVDDRDGDTWDEIAVTTDSNQILLLDGATGGIRWTAEFPTVPDGLAESVWGGPIQWIPPTAEAPSYLVASQSSDGPVTTSTLVLSLDGAIRSTLPVVGGVYGISNRTMQEGHFHVGIASPLGFDVIGLGRQEADAASRPR